MLRKIRSDNDELVHLWDDWDYLKNGDYYKLQSDISLKYYFKITLRKTGNFRIWF